MHDVKSNAYPILVGKSYMKDHLGDVAQMRYEILKWRLV
jgi:hypothetical protein